MNIYHIALTTPCKECEEKSIYYVNLLKKLYEKSRSCADKNEFQCEYGLPSALFDSNKMFFSMVIPKLSLDFHHDNVEKHEELINQGDFGESWLDLTTTSTADSEKLLIERLQKFILTKQSDEDEEEIIENIAEQLHKIADKLPSKDAKISVYWMICDHIECLNISKNIPIYGALKRLQLWNDATVTWLCDIEEEFCHDILASWNEILEIVVTNIERLKFPWVQASLVWYGSITTLDNQVITKDALGPGWQLIKTNCMSHSANRNLVQNSENKVRLANKMAIVCEFGQSVIPAWRMLPYKFILYNNKLANQIPEKLLNEYEKPETNETESVLLAYMEIMNHEIAGPDQNKRTKTDWIEFVEAGLVNDSKKHSKTQCNPKTPTDTLYLVLRPMGSGLFIVYFLRPEKYLYNLHSTIAVYEASFVNKKSRIIPHIDLATCVEKQWLKLLDRNCGIVPSPLKSQFSLAVHLDASEMLKHFTKDGKPLKKELESLKRQIEERRRKLSDKEDAVDCETTNIGIDYCTDNNTSSSRSFSPKLFPKHVKHETLSICNTPKTLAKAKLQGTKRKTMSECGPEKTTDETTKNTEQPSTSKAKKARLSTTASTSLAKKAPSTQGRTEIKNQATNDATVETTKEQATSKKKKRKSFDGTEASFAPANSSDPDTKEKRSERHKRRLARVVKRALMKYGVDPKEDYFETCSERLYYLCKSFLKDLRTSEGLNTEMKRLAESNVANVVEFEKRKRATEQPQSKT